MVGWNADPGVFAGSRNVTMGSVGPDSLTFGAIIFHIAENLIAGTGEGGNALV